LNDSALSGGYGSIPSPSTALSNRRNADTVRVQLERKTPPEWLVDDEICVVVAMM
jgi:hypothetical protein